MKSQDLQQIEQCKLYDKALYNKALINKIIIIIFDISHKNF